MRIAMDAIVHEYFALSLSSIREIAMKAHEERDQEIMTMRILESMLSLGTIEHEFDAEQNIDIFTSTPRLIWNLTKPFPGHTLIASVDDEHVVYEISGDRSYFFNRKWLPKRLRKEGKQVWQSVVNPEGT
jgi:hypothetical protein